MRRARLVLAGCLAALVAAPAVRAQTTGTVPVTATVDNTALVVQPVSNLDFGTVTRGTPVTVSPRSASAAYIDIQGAKNAQIVVTWTLPTTLSTGSGGVTMPITFANNSACYNRNSNQANCTRYNPVNSQTRRVRNQNPPNNNIGFWIGGTVSPSATQKPGVYRGTITLTAVYTGN